jgi:hypothetical protein
MECSCVHRKHLLSNRQCNQPTTYTSGAAPALTGSAWVVEMRVDNYWTFFVTAIDTDRPLLWVLVDLPPDPPAFFILSNEWLRRDSGYVENRRKVKEAKEADDRSVRSAIARLSPDEIAVMQRHMRGESAVDIGLDLGIHADRVEEMFKRIIKIWTADTVTERLQLERQPDWTPYGKTACPASADRKCLRYKLNAHRAPPGRKAAMDSAKAAIAEAASGVRAIGCDTHSYVSV